MRKILAAIARIFSPGYGTCYKCGMPWTVTKEHLTEYTFRNYSGTQGMADGCFPLCEHCWQALKTPEARLPYYKMLHARWLSRKWQGAVIMDILAKWPSIELAVRAGK